LTSWKPVSFSRRTLLHEVNKSVSIYTSAAPQYACMSCTETTLLLPLFLILSVGRDSSVGIATDYGLNGPDRIPVEARFSAPVQTGPAAHPASCTIGTGSFPRIKSGRGVTLTPHPLLMPWSRNSKAIPLLPLWAVRPVQSRNACKRVHFTFNFILSALPGRSCIPTISPLNLLRISTHLHEGTVSLGTSQSES